MAGTVQVLREGTWLYDGAVPCRVRVVGQDWDYYHEPGFDPEPPDLDAEGWAYYVMYGSPVEPDAFAGRSRTCLSLKEAVALAERTLDGPIRWSDAL